MKSKSVDDPDHSQINYFVNRPCEANHLASNFVEALSVELNHDNSMLAIEIIVEGFVEDLSNICYWGVNISQSSSVNISPRMASNMRGEIKNHPHLRECFGDFHQLNHAFFSPKQFKEAFFRNVSAKNSNFATQKNTPRL